MADLEAIADNLSELTVMEAAQLVKMLEEKWGVSAAAPVAVAAAGAAPGAAAAAESVGTATAVATPPAGDVQTAAVQAVLADKMGDAPLCDTCGHITVRNGSCYRCLNCGDSKGCS